MTQADELADRLRSLATRRGSYALRDGTLLDTYFDEYLLASDPELLGAVAELISARIPSSTDLLAGVALGGIPIAIRVSAILGLPALCVRTSPKDYGNSRLVEGPTAADRQVVIIDAVVRTGRSVLEAGRALTQQGARVRYAVCVIERPIGGREALERAGIDLRSLYVGTSAP